MSLMINTLDGINNRFNIAEENISELKGMGILTIQMKQR